MSSVDKQTMDKAAELFGWAYGLGGFNVAVLEFVKFVRAQVLQQLAPELERYDIQGGDGNGVYPDKDKDGEWSKAEDALAVIGSLREAFNIKCRVDADEQAESVKLQHVLFADYRDCRPTDAGLFGWAAAALIAKAQGVVMPERKTKADYGVYINEFADEAAAIYNAALDEVARLNTIPVQQVSVPDGFVLAKETVVEMPDGSKELGYTTIGRVGIFNSAEEVFDAIRELDLPLGWVSMTTEQLLPGWMLAAAPAAPAADAGLVEALDYQALFDAIAAATSVYANGAINISVQAFRDALAAHRAKGVE